MIRKPFRRAGALLAVLGVSTAAGLSGCSAHGPLRVGTDDRWSTCFEPSYAGADTHAVGSTYVTNSGEFDITIQDVTLDKPTDVAIVSAWLVADDPEAAFPLGITIPPSGDDRAEKKWTDRRQAEGAVLHPGERWQVIVVAKMRTVASSFDGVRIRYKSQGATYSDSSGNHTGIDDGKGHC